MSFFFLWKEKRRVSSQRKKLVRLSEDRYRQDFGFYGTFGSSKTRTRDILVELSEDRCKQNLGVLWFSEGELIQDRVDILENLQLNYLSLIEEE